MRTESLNLLHSILILPLFLFFEQDKSDVQPKRKTAHTYGGLA